MSDKVWVIHEPRPQRKTTAERGPSALKIEKNPALGFSVSLLLWGSGQMYNGQRILGFFFILMMANFYAILPLIVLYWNFVAPSLASIFINTSQIIAVWGMFYFTGLILWGFNAIHAYYKSSHTRAESFQGVNIFLLPPLCSFFIPGWGQFLNGQPKKGGCLLVFALAGHFLLSTFLLILFLWPALNTDMDRLLLERALAIAVLLSPLIFLMWVFSIYDALRISLDPVKKQPIRKRIQYAINRMRVKGWKNAVAAWAKLNLALILFLALSLILSYHYFPQRDYVTILKSLEVRLSNQKMVLIPRLIDQFIQTALTRPPHR